MIAVEFISPCQLTYMLRHAPNINKILGVVVHGVSCKVRLFILPGIFAFT